MGGAANRAMRDAIVRSSLSLQTKRLSTHKLTHHLGDRNPGIAAPFHQDALRTTPARTIDVRRAFLRRPILASPACPGGARRSAKSPGGRCGRNSDGPPTSPFSRDARPGAGPATRLQIGDAPAATGRPQPSRRPQVLHASSIRLVRSCRSTVGWRPARAPRPCYRLRATPSARYPHAQWKSGSIRAHAIDKRTRDRYQHTRWMRTHDQYPRKRSIAAHAIDQRTRNRSTHTQSSMCAHAYHPYPHMRSIR